MLLDQIVYERARKAAAFCPSVGMRCYTTAWMKVVIDRIAG